MMQTNAAVLSFGTSKCCFAAVPKTWGLSLSDGKVLVLKVESGAAQLYVSWSGETTRPSQTGEDTVVVSGLLASKAGLRHGDQVIVSPVTDVSSCERISLEPLSVDDWEILELNASTVESDLLSQIRVVAPDQVFPIWLHQTICVYVKIGVVGWTQPCALLEERTEVLISPRVRSGRRRSSPGARPAASVPAAPPPAADDSLVTRLTRFLSGLGGGGGGGDAEEEGDLTERPGCTVVGFAADRLELQLRVQRTMPGDGGDACWCAARQPHDVVVGAASLWPRGAAPPPAASHAHFMATLTRVPPPGAPAPGDKTESDGAGDEQVVVRVIVVEGGACVAAAAVIDGHVTVSDSLRRRLGLDVTGRVKLTPLTTHPVRCSAISLTPLSALPVSITAEKVKLAFVHRLETSTTDLPMVLCQGSLITVLLMPDEAVEFLVTFTTSSTARAPVYCLLTGRLAGRLRVSVTEPNATDRFPSVRELDPVLPDVQLDQLSGLQPAVARLLQATHHGLACTPLAARLRPGAGAGPGPALLVCGARGAGKTRLTQAVVTRLARPPTLAHITQVDCRRLRGKRLDSLKQVFEKVFTEARWRSPAIVVLDDLDALVSSCSQESVAENLYSQRIAEVLRDAVQESASSRRVCVVATSTSSSSLHPCLLHGDGRHFFREVISIKPLSTSERVCMLRSVLADNKSVSPSCVERVHPDVADGGDDGSRTDARTAVAADAAATTLQLDAVAARTEGFVARDLKRLTERAVWHHLMTKSESHCEEEEVSLRTCDFEAALTDFTPAALRNVPLHRAGSLGWTDVGGLKDVKQTLMETLKWPSKYPKLFASCPLRLRSGLLLYGAPGTGKTLLAGVVAKECGLNFISIKGPELLNKYIGASEQAVRDTFTRAQSAKPSIIFFDEFDALAPRRGHDSTGVTDRVVNQLLTELDGVENLEGVYVLAATSRPDLIDPALLRPGRLDKALHCPLPTEAEREEILRLMTRSLQLGPDVDLTRLAARCPHFTGADLKALLYNAQVAAIHQRCPADSRAAKEAPTLLGGRTGRDEGGGAMSVIHIPRLEDGVEEPTGEERGRLEREAVLLVGDLKMSSPVAMTTEPSVPISVITSEQLLAAAYAMTPSVSSRERDKYTSIYNDFVSPSSSQHQKRARPNAKRATLA